MIRADMLSLQRFHCIFIGNKIDSLTEINNGGLMHHGRRLVPAPLENNEEIWDSFINIRLVWLKCCSLLMQRNSFDFMVYNIALESLRVNGKVLNEGRGTVQNRSADVCSKQPIRGQRFCKVSPRCDKMPPGVDTHVHVGCQRAWKLWGYKRDEQTAWGQLCGEKSI